MIGGKKIEAKDGIAIGGDVENSLLVNGEVTVQQNVIVNVIAETLAPPIDAAPRCLDWEQTEAPYDTFGIDALSGADWQKSTHEALLDWLQQAEAPPVFLLLGEYGMGKTLECQRLYCRLRDIREQSAPPEWARPPIYLDLRRAPQFTDAQRTGKMALPAAKDLIEGVIVRAWAEAEGARHPGYADIKAWLATGALLIVDGLDECLVHLASEQHQAFLSIWLDLMWDASGQAQQCERRLPRLLMSCRSEFFKNLGDQRRMFERFDAIKQRQPTHPGRSASVEFVLQPLTEDRIYRYIERVSPQIDRSAAQALIEGTHNLADLSQRPITLKFLAEKVPVLLSRRDHTGTLNAASLYQLVVEDVLQNDTGKHHLSAKHKRTLLAEYAAQLWRLGVRRLPHDALSAWFHDRLEALRMRDPKAERDYAGMLSDRLEEDLRTATLLAPHNTAPSEQESEKDAEGFGFAHTSMQEYFLAVHLADAVREDRPEDWAMAIPSVETLNFLAQTLELEQAALLPSQRKAGGLSATLSAWAGTYRAEASELLLKYALHARTTNVAVPLLPDLRDADFSGAQLRGWRFGERFQDNTAPLLDLSRIRWAGADLRETYFAHVSLDDGDFSGARLDLAAFQHCSAQRCDWRQSDLVGSVFRHCRLEGSQWQPLRQCHRPKLVACTGVDDLPGVVHPPLAEAAPAHPTLTHLPPRLRAAITSQRGWVPSVALSADGVCLVSGSGDGTVRVWDVSSGELVRELHAHAGSVNGVALRADGGLMVSGSDDGTVRVWDVSSGELIRELRGHTESVNCVAISADGSRVASGSSDVTVRIWEVMSGKSVLLLRGHTDSVQSVALSVDGSVVVSGSFDCTVRVWNVSSGECVHELLGHTNWVRSVALSADGTRVVSGSSDDTVRVWDAMCGELVREMRGHTNSVLSVALSADGSHVVSCSSDQTLRVWDAMNGNLVRELRGHTHSVQSVALSAKSGRVVLGSQAGILWVWDAMDGGLVRELRGHTDWIWSVALSADGGRVASGSNDGRVQVWDVPSGELVRELRGHQHRIFSVALSADGGRVVSGSDDGTVRVWNAMSGEIICELHEHAHSVRTVTLSADGDRVALSLNGGKVREWDVMSGNLVGEMSEHTLRVKSLALAADVDRVRSDSRSGKVYVLGAVSGEFVCELRGNARPEDHFALSADGGCLVSGSYDGTVRVWDVSSGELVRELRGYQDHVLSVALSADGGVVVSGSVDGKVCCFASADGRAAATAEDLQCIWMAAVGSPHGIPSHASWRPGVSNRLVGGPSGPSVSTAADSVELGAEAPPANAGAETATDTGDVLISASGDAWRFLSWDVEDPTEPGGWRRVPLQGYE